MKVKIIRSGFILLLFGTQIIFAQTLPADIKSYLNKNYKGWKLSPSEKDCGSETNRGFVKGNFNADRNPDYAVKFTRGKKGFIIAFLAQRGNYKPFVLHNTQAGDINSMSLMTWKKGEIYEVENVRFRLKYDAPAEYRCESDVGGIHYYRNGKFIAY